MLQALYELNNCNSTTNLGMLSKLRQKVHKIRRNLYGGYSILQHHLQPICRRNVEVVHPVEARGEEEAEIARSLR
mgnify:FL=1